MSTQTTSRIGHCPCCGTQIADGATYFTSGPLNGQMRSITRWFNAFDVVVISTAGHQIHVKLCGLCAESAHLGENLRVIWNWIIEGFELEATKEYRASIGAINLSKNQLDQQYKTIEGLKKNTLVGVYTKRGV